MPSGVNESLLEAAGFRLIDREDRTASVLLHATGRLQALTVHGPALESMVGPDTVAGQQRHLEAVIELSERRALTRVIYLAEPVGLTERE